MPGVISMSHPSDNAEPFQDPGEEGGAETVHQARLHCRFCRGEGGVAKRTDGWAL